MTDGTMTHTAWALFALCVAGIYASYLTQGLMSERLSLKAYGRQRERFEHLEALGGAQAAVCCAWGALLLAASNTISRFRNVSKDQTHHKGGALLANGNNGRERDQRDAKVAPADGVKALNNGANNNHNDHKHSPAAPAAHAPWNVYWKPALSNAVGPACGLFALNNISYTAQVLAKSCKMVPVMLVGTALHKKHYTGMEYLCMTLIGLGVGMFAKRGSAKMDAKLAQPNPAMGYALCFVNLFLDGYTNAAQDAILHKYPRNSPLHMMCWMNFWTALYYSIYLSMQRSTARHLIMFYRSSHEAIFDTALFCICGAVGQIFIFMMIKRFGSLANTLVCTTRKFFNILLSVVVNANPLLQTQWMAVAMVFTGLLTNSLTKSKRHKKVA